MQPWCLKSSCWISAEVMKIVTLATSFLILFAVNTDVFASRILTLYLDGTQIEQRETARKGYLEINIPAAALKDSLKIAPEKGVEIIRVSTAPQKPAKNVVNELGQLDERENLLKARLKALSVREEIFKSAAKSQSAKAPRRTKTNPEPLATIKQGTDYAITQLESVYHAKLKAEKELAQIEVRRKRLDQQVSGGTVAMVWVTPASGGVIFSWSEPDISWVPAYQLRVDAYGTAGLSLMAQELSLAQGERATLVLAPLKHEGNPFKFRYESGWKLLKKEEFNVTNSLEPNSSPYTVSFANNSGLYWPPGDVSCFKNGVYTGNGRFQGVEIGKSVEIVCSSR